MRIAEIFTALILAIILLSLNKTSFANSFIDTNSNSVDDRTEKIINLVYDDKDTILVIYQVQRAFNASFAIASYLFDKKYQSDINPVDLKSSIDQIAIQVAQNDEEFKAFIANVTLIVNSIKCLDYLAVKKGMLANSDLMLDIKKAARSESLDKETLKANLKYSEYMNLLSNSPTLKPVTNQIYQNIHNQQSDEFCDNVLIGRTYNIQRLD